MEKIEFKIMDAESLGRLVEALTKNGYRVSTYVIWKNGKFGEIDYFAVQIGGHKRWKMKK